MSGELVIETQADAPAVAARLSTLDRFLPVWIGVAMVPVLVGLVYVALWARGRLYPLPTANQGAPR